MQYTGWTKKWHHCCTPYNFSNNINRFFKKNFDYRNQETTCNKTITIDPTTPQVCRYRRDETETRRCSFRDAGRDLEAPESLESFNVSPRHFS